MDGLWAFLALAVVLSVTPGPDDVLVMNSALRGRRLGVATAAGVATGSLMWGLATAVGLSALVSRSPAAYDGLRLAGAGYLVILGLTPIMGAAVASMRRPVTSGRHALRVSGHPGPGVRSAFAVGLVSDVLNPKIGLFYVSVLPQFIPAGAPTLQYSMALCAIDLGVATIWFLGLIWLADAAVTWSPHPRILRACGLLLPVTLVALGASVALSV